MDAQPSLHPVDALRCGLRARLERLLQRPVVAAIVGAGPPLPGRGPSPGFDLGAPDLFQTLAGWVDQVAPPPVQQGPPGEVDADTGTWTLPIALDYDDRWRGLEREVMEEVDGAVEQSVLLLTPVQKALLMASPSEFMLLGPPPEQVELLAYKAVRVGGAQRVVSLTLAERPDNPAQFTHVAIVPNLVPLERQLKGIDMVEKADPDGPLAPLRALIGLDHGPLALSTPAPAAPARGQRLDAHQATAIALAAQTPHFAALQGPPGSGKTTVISSIVEAALEAGKRVLVVSPTNVAVDNVVEKLSEGAPNSADTLRPCTLPLRYGPRASRLLPGAAGYWVGPKGQRRAATLSLRLQARLVEKLDQAAALYDRLDASLTGAAPLSQALAAEPAVLCGTPIGLLSAEELKSALPASFDLLVVDEVSKLTLPEFLAIAPYARAWVLVGDPQQLPPYNNACENGAALDDVLDPELELVCSAGAVLERLRPEARPTCRLVVVAQDPDRAAHAIRAHIQAVGLDGAPRVSLLDGGLCAGIRVCGPAEVDDAVESLSSSRDLHRFENPEHEGSVRILVQRGLWVQRPEIASGARLVEERLRAPAALFEKAFDTYHTQPWTLQAEQKLLPVTFRKGLEKSLPSAAALLPLGRVDSVQDGEVQRAALVHAIAARFALHAISIYDWLVGMPTDCFDVAPLAQLPVVTEHVAPLRAAVTPFVATLKRQYRMHPSLSRVPRSLFYFGEALQDGVASDDRSCRVRLVPVQNPKQRDRSNDVEVEAIAALLLHLAQGSHRGAGQRVLIITPYRDQERNLRNRIQPLQDSGALGGVELEICTLDRCQGREADYVLLSLVRSRSTPFLDAPKRWNVALTRARAGLFIFGDIRAYQAEADKQRAWIRRNGGLPKMSLLARIIESYSSQAAGNSPVSSKRIA